MPIFFYKNTRIKTQYINKNKIEKGFIQKIYYNY
jgi:hypothetical protein